MCTIHDIINEKVESWDNSILDIFLKTRQKDLRYASFDYCYNHFYKFHKIKDYEKSCAILWSYLSSWGMLRGSAPLLKQSYYFLKRIVDYIAYCGVKHKDYWDIDFPYKEKGKDKLSTIYEELESRIKFSSLNNETDVANPSNILITKIMLGIFGTIPAFDRYVSLFFKYLPMVDGERRLIGNSKVNNETCERINQIANIHGFPNLDNLLQNEKFDTLLFSKGHRKRKYTKAKLIDMYCFIVGQSLAQAK